MKLTRIKYALITAERPTLFLTETAELSESFDDAIMLRNHAELKETLKTLDEPNKFKEVKVTISIEV